MTISKINSNGKKNYWELNVVDKSIWLVSYYGKVVREYFRYIWLLIKDDNLPNIVGKSIC